MILDTSVVIEKVKRGETIDDNITSITLIEYPPIVRYKGFRGRIYFVGEEDQLLAFLIQSKLRKIGFPLSAADLLVASVCIRRDEELVTTDEDFKVIQKVEPRFRVKLLEAHEK